MQFPSLQFVYDYIFYLTGLIPKFNDLIAKNFSSKHEYPKYII